MKRQLKIIIILILILLLFFQIVVYQLKKEKNKNIVKNEYKEVIYSANLRDVFEEYKGDLNLKKTGEILYKLINQDLLKIYNITNNKTEKEIRQYYKENTGKIEEMNIYTETDFYLLSKQIKYIYENKYNTYINSEVITNSIKKNQNGYRVFDLNIIFNNNSILLKTKISLAENKNLTPKIKIADNSEIKKMFEEYKGVVDLSELINTVEDFNKYIQSNYKKIIKLSVEQILEYYNKNKEELNKIGINSEKDFLNISKNIIDIDWRNSQNINFYDFKIKTLKKEKDYTSIEMVQHITYKQDMYYLIKLANNKDITPRIKIERKSDGIIFDKDE